nr:cyclin-dependent kinase inhibitor 4-like [Tanacetum cinerariifolium]
MGKYMGSRNRKTSHEVSLMDIPSGVRTRARTLALQKSGDGACSYIQLRSRRLVKLTATKRQKEALKVSDLVELNAEKLGVENEDSIGENCLEIDARGRSTRETTPCNLIRDPDNISTPGSSTKRAYSTNTNYRVQNSPPRPVPSTVEMDEFFTEPEKQQQQLFIEKYNFDPVNDKPLPGRYEWVKVDGEEDGGGSMTLFSVLHSDLPFI